MFTDPSGEIPWIPVIIGAVIGAYSGGTIANNGQLNPTKWDWNSGKTWGFMFGGAIVGGVAGGVSSTIATSIGSSISVPYGGLLGSSIGGAAGGVIAGAGFAGLSGNNIFEGAWKGGLSGLFGGAVGSYIGGGGGAISGGFTTGAINTALNDGNFEQVLTSGIVSGIVGYGFYRLQTELSFNKYKANEGTWSHKQYRKISAAVQRSFSRGKEFGGCILDNGNVSMWNERTSRSIQPTPRPVNAIGEFHTHPNIGVNKASGLPWLEAHSTSDIKYTVDRSYVIGRNNTWFYDPFSNNSLSTILYSTSIHNPYPYHGFGLKLLK